MMAFDSPFQFLPSISQETNKLKPEIPLRSQPVSPPMVDYLSEEIILIILHRLPVKTLLRCTGVCKSWYSLITSPQFIHSHLNFAAGETPLVLLRRCIRNRERYDLYSDGGSFAGDTTFEFPFRSVNSFFTIVGSCNGLLCLSDDRVYYMQTIVLWNPCIRKLVLLPKPNPVYGSNGLFVQCLGFGFDSVGSDYKVVRITYVDCGRNRPQVELYKLNTEVWEDMSFLNLDYVIYNKSRQAYIHGSTHWVASYMDYSHDLIVLFDMSHEVFREMMLPINLEVNSLITKDLVVYRDSLALITSNVSGFRVWVMKEYGVQESWSKHLSFDFVDLSPGFTPRPLWVGKHGEVITVRKDGHLIAYNPEDVAESKDLGVGGSRSEDYLRSVYVDSYVKSLVLMEKVGCFSDAVTREKLPNLMRNDCDYGHCSEHSCGSEYKTRYGSYAGNRA